MLKFLGYDSLDALVDALVPRGKAVRKLFLGEAEHALPLGAEVYLVRKQVPLPQAALGALHRQVEPLVRAW